MSRLEALLEASARACPEKIALEEPGGRRITYAELDRRAGEVAQLLKNHGVQPGDRVGIYMPKSIDKVAALFGVLKAGAAYLPVDVGSPVSRNAFIFRDCRARLLLVADTLTAGLAEAGEGKWGQALAKGSRNWTLLSGPGYASEEESSPDSQQGPSPPEDLAYILYTSGSTGQPKGVMWSHTGALRFIHWCSETFAPTADDRFSSHAPFHFDLSILDIFVSLKHGATLILIDEAAGKRPQQLAELISRERITHWYSTPSVLRLLVEYGKMEPQDYSALRTVLFAGEVFPVKHLRALTQLWKGARFFNLYGPTETNVCTFYEIPPEIPPDRTEPYPIGRACSHYRTRVVDEQGQDVPPEEAGELVVAGPFMEGYWNLPHRTAEAFFTDAAGERWYRTGDVVREQPDGNYIFLGRRDRMVKRRGYRVELGEIEAALYRHPAVAEAAVVALPDEESGVLIKAYLHTKGAQRLSIIELKRFCMEQLPPYMIPDRFEFLEALPKTSTDKIDYQRLQEVR